MSGSPDFDALIAEATSASVDGWGFGWLDGRANEARPSWGYAGRLVARVAEANTALDLQTGGAEVLCEVLDRAPARPSTVVATDSWPPSLTIAAPNLARRGGSVVAAADDGPLPFPTSTFDLVSSRHPVRTPWREIARVLTHGGHYFAQHVGSGSNRELTDFMMGPQPVSGARTPANARADAGAAGLDVVDLREETLRVEFSDVGAVVWFLRKVVWTVPDFTVERYHDRLVALHEHIRHEGCFVSHAPRFLIDAVKPPDGA
jgi:SAM-dependent methyltransferase